MQRSIQDIRPKQGRNDHAAGAEEGDGHPGHGSQQGGGRRVHEGGGQGDRSFTGHPVFIMLCVQDGDGTLDIDEFISYLLQYG